MTVLVQDGQYIVHKQHLQYPFQKTAIIFYYLKIFVTALLEETDSEIQYFYPTYSYLVTDRIQSQISCQQKSDNSVREC